MSMLTASRGQTDTAATSGADPAPAVPLAMARSVPLHLAKTPSLARALLTRGPSSPPRPHPQRQPARNQPRWSHNWRTGGPTIAANTATSSSMLTATPSPPFTAVLTSSTRHRPGNGGSRLRLPACSAVQVATEGSRVPRTFDCLGYVSVRGETRHGPNYID